MTVLLLAAGCGSGGGSDDADLFAAEAGLGVFQICMVDPNACSGDLEATYTFIDDVEPLSDEDRERLL